MLRAGKLGLVALAFLTASPSTARAQDPLKVEVSAGTHHRWQGVSVRVKNLTRGDIDLIAPGDENSIFQRLLRHLPITLERLEGDEWTRCEPDVFTYHPESNSNLTVYPDFVRTLTFAVVSPGLYRVRVWYIAVPGELMPPRRPPVLKSILSPTFEIVPTDSASAAVVHAPTV